MDSAKKNSVSSQQRAMHRLVLVAVVVGVAFLVVLRLGDVREKWALVQGRIVDTRIVADGIESKGGARLIWSAEYKVAYSVAGREHTVWTDSGIRGESEDEVRLALSRWPSSCTVRYDPEKPESSVADCR